VISKFGPVLSLAFADNGTGLRSGAGLVVESMRLSKRSRLICEATVSDINTEIQI
jgi:hypothetical protein